ncbi:uncharacterized protein LOC129719753 [Wyeomyia smithii]|uniref:uncharacterized protein LOC129719753 n=1 Tax=Wyeomyia smithii TaxID=174621 RepID=UPI0024681F0D|nr:uncharacterized protein LOC129719753 [Wyeomyia smithii]
MRSAHSSAFCLVYDVLKTKSLSRFLTNARKLVKIMRCQPYVNSFKLDQSRNLPFLDGDTRWGSAYLMINRLQDEKDFIISLLPPQLLKSFNTKFWQRVDQFVLAAKPVYILTKRIQEETLLCGSFYLYWQECCLELQEIGDTISKRLLKALNHRRHMWMDNAVFLAALYVDPRLTDFEPAVLTSEQKETAIQHLLVTWKAIQSLRTTATTPEKTSTSPTASPSPIDLHRVQKFLLSKRLSKSSSDIDIEKRIRRIQIDMCLPLDANMILDDLHDEDREVESLQLKHQAIMPDIIERFFDVQQCHSRCFTNGLVPPWDLSNSSQLVNGEVTLSKPELFWEEDSYSWGKSYSGLRILVSD